MVWWIIGALIAVLVLYLLFRAWSRRDKNPYLAKAQNRVNFANNLWAEMQRQSLSGELDYQKVAETEGQLHKIWLAQRGEVSKVPVYGEYYAALIEYLYRKTSDIRATGGQNIPQIDAKFDPVFERAYSLAKHARQARIDLDRRWGVEE